MYFPTSASPTLRSRRKVLASALAAVQTSSATPDLFGSAAA